MTISLAGDSPDWSNSQAPVPLVPTDSIEVDLPLALITEVLPALTDGHYYLYGLDWDNLDMATTTEVSLLYAPVASLAQMTVGMVGPRASLTWDLGGFKTNSALIGSYCTTLTRIVIRYAIGP